MKYHATITGWGEDALGFLEDADMNFIVLFNENAPEEFLKDTEIESGISSYAHYKWEQPHYHTITSEYCYILTGETKYIDLSENKEYHFCAGDFYVLRQGTPYLQKCQAGCQLFFVKAPGINDKVSLALTKEMND